MSDAEFERLAGHCHFCLKKGTNGNYLSRATARVKMLWDYAYQLGQTTARKEPPVFEEAVKNALKYHTGHNIKDKAERMAEVLRVAQQKAKL